MVGKGCSVTLISAQVAQGRQKFADTIVLELWVERQVKTLGGLRINSTVICS